jgi:hypothetical protein
LCANGFSKHDRRNLVWAGRSLDYAATPWFLYQIAIVVLLFLAAKLVARRIRGPTSRQVYDARGAVREPRVDRLMFRAGEREQ